MIWKGEGRISRKTSRARRVNLIKPFTDEGWKIQLINPPFFHELLANSERIFSFRGKLQIKSLLILFSRLRQSSPSPRRGKKKRRTRGGREKRKREKRGWSIYEHRFIFQRSLTLIRFNKPIRYKNPPFTRFTWETGTSALFLLFPSLSPSPRCDWRENFCENNPRGTGREEWLMKLTISSICVPPPWFILEVSITSLFVWTWWLGTIIVRLCKIVSCGWINRLEEERDWQSRERDCCSISDGYRLFSK